MNSTVSIYDTVRNRRLSFGLDITFVVFLVCIFWGISEFGRTNAGFNGWLRENRISHLGGEYDAIAYAIRNGRGFADPFREETGPTAWMPPVLPYLLALLYFVFCDNRNAVLNCVIFLQAISTILVGIIFIRQARKLGCANAGYVLLICGYAEHFHELFQKTHDVWIVQLAVILLWQSLVRQWQCPSKKVDAFLSGVFGGILTLTTPVLGATWASLVTFRWLPTSFLGYKTPQFRFNLSQIVIACVVSIAVVAPWTLRNRITLGVWIPIKSNLMFELYQSTCLDDDGLIDSDSTAEHPWTNAVGEQRRRYKQLGEMAFIHSCGSSAAAQIQEDPVEFARRIARRFLAATLVYHAFRPVDTTRVLLMRLKRLIFPIPFICILVVTAIRRNEPEVLAAITIYFMVLAPYIIVSYYDRYAVPVMSMKLLIVLYAYDVVKGKLNTLNFTKRVV